MVLASSRRLAVDSTIEDQYKIVKAALLAIAGVCDGAATNDGAGFNAMDAYRGRYLADTAQCDELSPTELYEAWKLCRKYWRQLKKSGIVLPKTWRNEYRLEGMTVHNLSKGSSYNLTWIGDEDLACECEAYKAGHECGHIKFAIPLFDKPYAEFDDVEDVMESAPPPAPTTTDVELLPGITATADQAKALDELLGFVQDRTATIHLLTGYSGTGKSTLVQALVKRLRDQGDHRSIVFTAPTNKAAGVLRSMVSRWGLGIDCITCAKLLGLRPKIDFETGGQIFVKDYGQESTAQSYDLIVVDECSMVNVDLCFYLTEEANLRTQLLFMGDPAQLPPVNEAISPTFTEVESQSHLGEVKRYSGPIAVLADDIRRNLKRKGEPLWESDHTPAKTSGVWVMDDKQWNAALIKAFRSDAYKANPDYVRALAWTNRRVDGLNRSVRAAVVGAKAPRFVRGERLIANDPYFIEGEGDRKIAVFQSSDEMEILYEPTEGKIGDWAVWFLSVLVFSSGEQTTIPVLHESSVKEFKAAQAELAKRAKDGEKQLWQTWHDNNGMFANVTYAYAITVHKSQGSTFDNVFVDIGDIRANKTVNQIEIPGIPGLQSVYERNQLQYVACTRAAQRLFILD